MGKRRPKRLPLFDPLHRDDARQRGTLEPLFTRHFPNPQGSLASLLRDTQLPHTTLHQWNAPWRSDPDWRPWNLEAHGSHHRTFTKQEEEALSDQILTDHIAIGQLFMGKEFQLVAMEAFLTKYGDADAIPPSTDTL
jgi:hypothetical protein